SVGIGLPGRSSSQSMFISHQRRPSNQSCTLLIPRPKESPPSGAGEDSNVLKTCAIWPNWSTRRKRMHPEKGIGKVDKSLHIHRRHADATFGSNYRAEQPSAGIEQRAKAIPVARACRAGDGSV